ncbi:Telomere end binding protein [Penicillium coprophilum]|uniref:Telomere end binding protein n=1 Tax=Penicillium coprophilum TaxID=36646 RepID=UPI0023A31D5C|nr:Telomere end binding protein [Penicillium coprophilum]KAJ5165522.1 Telomere end binding protein [Penicillium coprophilum]
MIAIESPQKSPAPNAVAHLTRVPIAQLSPDLELLTESSFFAAVALVWPYSSSTKSVSLLLAEPDFRLRGAKGQIKVTFHGHLAEKVAESHVGIGDTVCLALKDTKFVSNESAQQTPGRSVAWDAHFENGGSLEIFRTSQPPLMISVEPQVSAPRETELAPPTTPSGKSVNPDLNLPSSARPWGSPVFLKSPRTSVGGTIRSAFDPFVEEDGFVPGKGRKKPRYSLHREDWRVINEPESPHEQQVPVDWEQALNQSIDQELEEADSASEPSDDPKTDAAQPPTYTEDTPQEPLSLFPKPSLELTGSILERRAGESNVLAHEQVDNRGTPFHLPTDTPQIRPIPSPGLPIPSPLISNHSGSAGYFLPWTTPTQPEDIRSVPTEMETTASSAETFTETPDSDPIDPILTETAESVDPDIETIEQEHILDAGFVFHDDSASSPGSESLPEEREVETIDSSKAIDGSDVVEAHVVINPTGGEPQIINEAQQEHTFDHLDLSHSQLPPSSGSEDEPNDSTNVNDESAVAQPDTSIENPADEARKGGETDDDRLIDVSYLWRDDSASSSRSDEDSDDESLESSQAIDGSGNAQTDPGIENANDNVESPQQLAISHDKKRSEPDNYLENYPQNTPAVDQDAIDALGRMIAVREEELERKRDMDEEKQSEDDLDDSSALGAFDRPPGQVYIEEKDEVYYAESVENYDSQNEYEEAEDDDLHSDPRFEFKLDEDDSSVDESSSERSEQEHQHLPSQTGKHEIIVLDSDSDDEPTSNHPVTETAQSAELDDGSNHFESGQPVVPPVTANFATDAQEYPELWYVDGEAGYHGAVEEDSEVDEGEESEESEEREDDQQDNRVHESDMDDDESTQDHYAMDNPEKDEDEEMDDAELIEGAASDESHATIKLGAQLKMPIDHDPDQEQSGNADPNLLDMSESYHQDTSSEMASPNPEQDDDEEMDDLELIEQTENNESYVVVKRDAQVEVAVDREADEEEPSNIDPHLLDIPQSHHRDPSSEMESHARQSIGGDGDSALHVSSSPRNVVADYRLTREPTVEGPEPLGGRVSRSVKPPFERQLLTPDPTQENASTRELGYDIEPEISFTVEENEPTSLDGTSQPAGFPESEQNGDIDTGLNQNIQQEIHVDRHDDAVASSKLAGAPEPPATPEAGSSVEVVISTECPRTPVAPIAEPPVPDRNASGLRSKLSYFAPLATLIDHYDALVDTISIVHEASPITRAKSGSKDWFVTIQLTDPSMAGTTLRAQIFRRYKASMPSLVEGTAILLRDFKVRSLDHTVMLVSMDSSAWAVFDGSGPDAETNGPPVEYGSQERAYASGLRRWYKEVGSDRVADRMLQEAIARDSQERDVTPISQVPSESGSPDSRRGSLRKRKSNRRVTIHELRDGTRYTEVGSPNSGSSSVHELRDGTLYANI